MLARSAARPGWVASAHSRPALVASRHARSFASMPNGRAGLSPTGTNSTGASSAMRAAHKGDGVGREGPRRVADLLLKAISRINPPRMAEVTEQEMDQRHGSVYRVAGTLNIARAATTQREIDALPDPLTIDLSEINRMDTVGAWIVYRTVRDRGAKVIGASRDEVSLLKQVADFDAPTQVHPEARRGFLHTISELGEWVAEIGRTLLGLLGFFGATLIGFANVIRRPARRFR